MSIAYFNIIRILWKSDSIPGHRESYNHNQMHTIRKLYRILFYWLIDLFIHSLLISFIFIPFSHFILWKYLNGFWLDWWMFIMCMVLIADARNIASNSSTLSHLRARRKAAKMLVVVVLMFAICYFPVHALNLAR